MSERDNRTEEQTDWQQSGSPLLTDYVWTGEDPVVEAGFLTAGALKLVSRPPSVAFAMNGSFVIPVTVDDLAANGLLGDE